MGKSSLMVQTARALRDAGTHVVVLDLTRIGQNLSPEQWYDGLLIPLGREFQLEEELDDFWNSNDPSIVKLGPMQRWITAIRDVILRSIDGNIVIFVDEIDAVRGLPFSTDEFFAGMRQLYNERTIDPDLERIAFCLLGVAKPSDLVRNVNTTPFNVGHRIELTDFTEQEAEPLISGLRRDKETGRRFLHRILWWTGGHPYLTQRMCAQVAEQGDVASEVDVDRVCAEAFLSSRAREKDDNLLFVRERVLRSEVDRASLLDLYSQIHRGKKVSDDDTSFLIDTLRLSGLVAVSGNRLAVRNRIYMRVFDKKWIRLNMPDAELRRQRAAYIRGIALAFAIIVPVLAIITALCFYARVVTLNEVRNNYFASVSSAQEAFNSGNYDKGKKIVDSFSAVSDQPSSKSVLDRIEAKASRALPVLSGWWKGRSAYEKSFPMRLLRAEASGEGSSRLKRQSSSQDSTAGCDSEMAVATTSFEGRPLVAAAGADSSVQIWYSDTKEAYAHLQLTDQMASQKGKTLSVPEMPLASCDPANPFNPPGIMSLSFSPDGHLLAISTGTWRNAQSPGSVLLWDLRRKKVTVLTAEINKTADSAEFSEDAKYLATSSEDGTAQIWKLDNGTAPLYGTHINPKKVRLPNGSIAGVGGSGAHQVALAPGCGRLSPGRDCFMALGYGDGNLVLYDYLHPVQDKPLYAGVVNVSGIMSLLFLDQKNKPLRLAVGSRDGELLLIDPKELIKAYRGGKENIDQEAAGNAILATLRPNQGVLQGLAVSYNKDHSKSWLLTSGSNGTIELWSLSPNLHLILTLKGHRAGVYGAAFCHTIADPKRELDCIVSASADHDVRVWQYPFQEGEQDSHRGLGDHRTGDDRLVFQAQMVGVVFTDQGKTLVTAVGATTEENRNVTGIFTTWDYRNGGRPKPTPANTDKRILGLDASPDGKFLVSSSLSRDLVFVDPKSDTKPLPVPVYVSLNPKIRVGCFNAEAAEITECSSDQHDYLVMGVAAREDIGDAQHPPGKGLCMWHIRDNGSLSEQRYSNANDIRNPCLDQKTSEGLHRSVDLSKAGMFDISRQGDNIAISLDGDHGTVVRIWKTPDLLNGGAPYLSTKEDPGFGSQFANMSFSPDGNYLAATTIDSRLYFWPVDKSASLPGNSKPVPLPARGQTLAFHPKEPILAIGLQDSSILLWSTKDQRDLMTIRQHTGGVLGLAFSPDGQTLASSGNDGQVRILRADTEVR
jgi:WD40 repeat protein